MKPIYYFFIPVIICITLVSATLNPYKRVTEVILQAANAKATPQMLSQSADIITQRLIKYGLKPEVSMLADKGQLMVRLPDNTELSEIKGLLTSKGEMGFYETLTFNELAALLKKNDLQELLKADVQRSPSDARFGCSASENNVTVDSLENCLRSLSLGSDYKLCWSMKNSRSMSCLYALKINKAGDPAIKRSDIETIGMVSIDNTSSLAIEIKLKAACAPLWKEITMHNIGKPIAIAVDDKVFYTPVVRDAMEKGLCEITGNFTTDEVNYFLALVNNEPLPVSFEIK
jgi:SecD/SecF fusion protein